MDDVRTMSGREPADFFVAGGTLPIDSASYLEREADKKLLESLLNSRFCYVLNSRQMGKSSLCVRTMSRLAERGIRCAFIDITKLGGRNVTPEQWYAGMALEIGRNTGLRKEILDYLKAEEGVGPMQRFFGALHNVILGSSNARLVIFVDEIDSTRSLPFNTDEFFAGVRECFNRRVQEPEFERLTFCFLGVAVPSDLIHDARTTPFNIGDRIYLRDFKPEEAIPLAGHLGQDGEDVLKRVLYWTNGHPFLTQSICRALMQHSRPTPAMVDEIIRRDLLEPKVRETNINLSDVGNRVLNGYADGEDVSEFRANILSAYQKALSGKEQLFDDESNRVAALLKLSGMMRSEGNRLYVRNRIYEKVFNKSWVRENMPGQELIRQRRAFWIGVIRTGSISLGVIGAITVLGITAKLEARRADRNERRALQNATRAQQNADLATEREAQATAQRKKAESLSEQLRTALTRERELALAESRARKLSDQRAREAMLARQAADHSASIARNSEKSARRSEAQASASEATATAREWDAYVANLRTAVSAIRGRQFATAKDLLTNLRHYPERGIEFDFTYRMLQSAQGESEFGRRETQLEAWASALTVSPSGAWLCAATEGGQLRIINRERATQRDTRERGAVYGIDISPDEKTLAFVTFNDNTLHALDISTWRELYRTSGDSVVRFSPDGARLAVNTDNRMYLHEPRTGRKLGAFVAPSDRIIVGQFDPLGTLLVTGARDGTVRLWDVPSSRLRHTIEQQTVGIFFSPIGDRFVTVSMDDRAHIWSLQGQQLVTLETPPGPMEAACFSKDGSRVLAIGYGGGLGIYDAQTGVRIVNLGPDQLGGRRMASARDGTLFVAKGDGAIVSLQPISRAEWSDWDRAEEAARAAREAADRKRREQMTRAERLRMYTDSATRFIESRSWDELIKISKLKLSQGEQRTEALANLGEAYYAKNQIEVALAYWRESLRQSDSKKAICEELIVMAAYLRGDLATYRSWTPRWTFNDSKEPATMLILAAGNHPLLPKNLGLPIFNGGFLGFEREFLDIVRAFVAIRTGSAKDALASLSKPFVDQRVQGIQQFFGPLHLYVKAVAEAESGAVVAARRTLSEADRAYDAAKIDTQTGGKPWLGAHFIMLSQCVKESAHRAIDLPAG